ncbi:CCT motif family protein [Musa troglodytarum]|uniref:CCT motif family protein n=1 Tax=Musa troglodytarum TaxID=320322 RepID=A0A9E7HIS6_9LILI|nr:CCT motif family protein [Musa troglodytarum]
MYAEAGMLSPFMQSFPPMAEQHLLPFTDLEDLLTTNFPDAASNPSTLFQTCAVSEYDLGGEGDLFKAPKPILEESVLAFDPIAAANSMIFGGESIAMEDKIEIADMEIRNEDPFCEAFYDCKNDRLATSTDAPVPETEEVAVGENNNIFAVGPSQKSVGFGCLSSVDCTNGSLQRGLSSIGPCLLDVHEMNLEAAFGMRAYSEGDIQSIGIINNLVHGHMNIVPSFELLSTNEGLKIEERIQKLSRYRKKRTKRNFHRKIKYACRKALADSQPRIRGRFAKIESSCAMTEHNDAANCRNKE